MSDRPKTYRLWRDKQNGALLLVPPADGDDIPNRDWELIDPSQILPHQFVDANKKVDAPAEQPGPLSVEPSKTICGKHFSEPPLQSEPSLDKTVIFVDGKRFTCNPPKVTGAYLQSLVGKDAQYQMFKESPGTEADQLIGIDQTIELSDGDRFYTVVNAYFAACEQAPPPEPAMSNSIQQQVDAWSGVFDCLQLVSPNWLFEGQDSTADVAVHAIKNLAKQATDAAALRAERDELKFKSKLLHEEVDLAYKARNDAQVEIARLQAELNSAIEQVDIDRKDYSKAQTELRRQLDKAEQRCEQLQTHLNTMDSQLTMVRVAIEKLARRKSANPESLIEMVKDCFQRAERMAAAIGEQSQLLAWFVGRASAELSGCLERSGESWYIETREKIAAVEKLRHAAAAKEPT